MSVMTATVLRLTLLPIETISVASAFASSNDFMKAPEPVFTSSTMLSAPAAIFFDMIELAINGIELTVAVTSRNA